MPGRRYPISGKVVTPTRGETLLVPPFVTQELFDSALSFRPDADDVVVCTHPKNGTTWMLYIIHMLLGRDSDLVGARVPDAGKADAADFHNHYVTLEFAGGDKTSEFPLPRLIKTHLNSELMSPLIDHNPHTKYVFVARNPKDAVVSYFYHTIGFDYADFADGDFGDFFDVYSNGLYNYGCYFQMVPKWWEESKKRQNVHFVLYEDLKTNFREEVTKIAAFLGEEARERLSADDGALLNKIEAKSDIVTMKNSGAKFNFKNRPEHLPSVRKGIIGDWRSLLSPDQSALMDSRLLEAGHHFPGFEKLWDNYRQHFCWGG